MAGSMVWITYTSDAGNTYATKQDETAQGVLSNPLWTGADSPEGIPVNVKPRHVVAEWVNAGTAGNGTGISVRRYAVSTAAALAALNIGDTLSLPEYQAIPGASPTTPNVMRDFSIVRKVAEVLKPTPRATDTGETQG